MQAQLRPSIDSTRFGVITIDGKVYKHDVVIRTNGRVEKRRKQLSKKIYGSSHTVSRDEIIEVYQDGARQLVVGTGMFNSLHLSDEAESFLREKSCQVILVPTPRLKKKWNSLDVPAIGLFHITC